MSKFFQLILILVFVSIVGTHVAARTVSGVVKNSVTAQPVPNVVVKILQTGDSTQTDVTGKYLFPNVPDGAYTFLVGRSNYQPLIRTNVAVGTCCVATVGNVDCSPGDGVDIGDLTGLIDNLFITFTPLCCVKEANCDGDPTGNVDIGDLTALIDNLFINFTPLPACQ